MISICKSPFLALIREDGTDVLSPIPSISTTKTPGHYIKKQTKEDSIRWIEEGRPARDFRAQGAVEW